MKLDLKQHLIIFIIGTFLPILVAIPLGLLGYLSGIDGGNAFVLFLVLSSLVGYYFLSFQCLTKDEDYSIIISIMFYANYIIYMITVLIAFNLLVVGGFLFTGQVPMGMQLEPTQAMPLTLLGVYLLVISSFGMYYLSYSKRRIKTISK